MTLNEKVRDCLASMPEIVKECFRQTPDRIGGCIVNTEDYGRVDIVFVYSEILDEVIYIGYTDVKHVVR